MTVRSSNTTVTFQRPFTMPSVTGRQPAGTYRVFMDDEDTPGIVCTFRPFRYDPF
jgi:hypothetical protein